MQIEEIKWIDSHLHVFPLRIPVLNILGKQLDLTANPLAKLATSVVSFGRKKLRSKSSLITDLIHSGLPHTSKLSQPLQSIVDPLGAMMSAPRLFIESTDEDLKEVMKACHLNAALALASPPWPSNESLLKLTDEFKADGLNVKTVVNIPPARKRLNKVQLKKKLANYFSQGAVALKIHNSIDGIEATDRHYEALIELCSDLKKPVIIHTGCIHLSGIYKKPEFARVENFVPLFEKFKDVKFVLAHMNFHDPEKAIEIAKKFSNTFLETSWQSSQTISKAIQEIGSSRVMFGSDWPLVGGNIAMGQKRLMQLFDTTKISKEELQNVAANTAEQVFALHFE